MDNSGMITFSKSQIEDLRDLQRATRDLGTETVIIGCDGLLVFIEDADRHWSPTTCLLRQRYRKQPLKNTGG
jgi:hypothetical protein